MQTEPSKVEPPKRKRRWYQFSLRSLLIGVTLLAVLLGYVGWQAKIVRERKAMMMNMSSDEKGYMFTVSPAPAPSPIPWLRRLLGDKAIDTIALPRNTPIEDRRLIRSYFPEAEVRWGGTAGRFLRFPEDEEQGKPPAP